MRPRRSSRRSNAGRAVPRGGRRSIAGRIDNERPQSGVRAQLDEDREPAVGHLEDRRCDAGSTHGADGVRVVHRRGVPSPTRVWLRLFTEVPQLRGGSVALDLSKLRDALAFTAKEEGVPNLTLEVRLEVRGIDKPEIGGLIWKVNSPAGGYGRNTNTASGAMTMFAARLADMERRVRRDIARQRA